MLKIHVVATIKVKEDFTAEQKQFESMQEAINCFMCHDWGNIDEEDKAANDSAYEAKSGKILARYNTLKGDIFIKLDFVEGADEQKAVIMYCNEY